MNIILSLIISILPVYLIGLYVYKKDKNKEPTKLLVLLFVFGMISCIPAAIIEYIITPMFGEVENLNLIFLFIYVSIGIALVEELCKWFIVYMTAYSNKAFDHIYDAIVYCVFVSLGFACFENILYVFSSDTIIIGFIRAITAIPGHASDAIMMGNYLGFAKIAGVNNNAQLNKRNLLLSILMPTLFHAIYDYCLFTGNLVFIVIFVGFVIYIYIFSFKKIKRFSSISGNFTDNTSIKTIVSNIKENNVVAADNNLNSYDQIVDIMQSNNLQVKNANNFCSNCGVKIDNNINFCPNCGKKMTD